MTRSGGMEGRRGDGWAHGVLAAVAYVPLLLTSPGLLNADTKQYLYLDPGGLLARAPSLWDPDVGLGTVTHQNIGYLWPMGPFFWAFERLGVPDWVAQRLWIGTILFAAGAGVLFLLRVLGVLRARARPAGVAAALVYMLSPFTLGYVTGASVILLPFAVLPWLVGLTIRAVREGGWRHPALVALVVTSAGSINGSSLVYVAVGPLLWLPFAVWVTREATLRRALGAAGRIGLLTVVTQLWWIVALLVGSAYGLPLLRTTETVEQVAATSSGPEVLRGLGYWFSYGGDNVGRWLDLVTPYMQAPWLLAATFAVPVIGVAAAALLRWRHRAYFATLAALGVVMAVGAHHPGDPSVLGDAFEAASRRSDLVLSLRNTQRAVPLVALSSAVLTGAALAALVAHRRPVALGAPALVAVVASVAMAPLWTGDLVAGRFHREDVPRYWTDAAEHLDETDDGTRVLELPGSDFAAYRWGNTLDPVTPGLTDRPVAARELVPFGSPASVALLNALDRRLQEGQLEPQALAPLARLMGAGAVLFRFDLEYERYRTPRPWVLWDLLTPTPEGLGPPVAFGEPAPNRAIPGVPMTDEIALATVPGETDPAPVVVFPVEDALPLVRARPLVRPVVLAGDGEGVVEAVSAGVLDGHRPVLYSADLGGDPATLQRVLDAGAELVLTDTNRRTAQRWFTLRENSGYTEAAGEQPLEHDAGDARLDVFPGSGDRARTVAVPLGGVRVRATAYGNPVSYVPDQRPSLAADGDLETAWLVGGFSEVAGERIRLDFDAPVTADRVVLVQPQRGALNRSITRVRMTFDGGGPVDAVLGDRSRGPEGQEVTFPRRTFERLEVEITGTDLGRRRTYHGVSGVGFAEIRVGDLLVDEVERLPTDVFDLFEPGGAGDHPLTVVMARRRANPAEPVRTDPEEALARAFALPGGRTFALAGTARLSAYAPDDVLDRLLGIPPAEEGGLTAFSSGRLPGDLAARASAAADGDPATHWSPGFLDQLGHWMFFRAPAPLTVDHLDLRLVADGRHSVPTELFLETDTGETRTIRLPTVADREEADAVVAVPVRFDPVTARELRFTVAGVREVRTRDWYSETQVLMPVAVAELGIPGLRAPTPATAVDSGCRDDLLRVDGRPLAVRVTGEATAAAGRGALAVATCDPAVDLRRGDHVVRAAKGRDTGLDLDRLVFRAFAESTPAGEGESRKSSESMEVRVTGEGRSSVAATVRGATEPFLFVVAQSANEGWTLAASGAEVGERRIVDGFANGWLVVPDGDGPIELAARWEPQRAVWAGLAVSAAGVLACAALVVLARRRRAAAPDPAPALAVPWGPVAWPPVPWRAAAGAAAVAAVAGALVAKPWVGIVLAVATVASLRLRRPALAAGVPAVLGMGVVAAFVVAGQVVRAPRPDFGWPEAFRAVHWPAVAVVLLVAVDAIALKRREVLRKG